MENVPGKHLLELRYWSPRPASFPSLAVRMHLGGYRLLPLVWLLCTEPAGGDESWFMAREDLHHLKTEVTLEAQVQLSAERHVTQGWGCCQWGSKGGILQPAKGLQIDSRASVVLQAGAQHIQSEGLAAEQGCKGLGEWHSKCHSAWWLTSGQERGG